MRADRIASHLTPTSHDGLYGREGNLDDAPALDRLGQQPVHLVSHRLGITCLYRAVVCTEPGSQGRQIQTLWGKKHPLEDRTRRRRMLQPTKDCATVVIYDNDLHVRFRLGLSQQQRRRVVGKGEVADDDTHWPAGAQPHTDRGCDGAVNARQPSVSQCLRSNVAGHGKPIETADDLSLIHI